MRPSIDPAPQIGPLAAAATHVTYPPPHTQIADETYRALYRHLAPHLRQPGMALIETADALGPRRPNNPLPASSSSFLPPLMTLRWASRAMRSSLKALLERVDQATATATGNHLQLAREEMDELGVVDFTEQVWELMELCLLADGAGAAGWEVVAWAAPFWGPLPASGRTPESAWHAAWEDVLRGELEHAAEILDAVGVSPDAGASYRGGAGAATAASMWFWPSHQVKDRVLSLLSACPLLRAMAVLREEAEARANGAGAASPDDDAYELRRREVAMAYGQQHRAQMRAAPASGVQGMQAALAAAAYAPPPPPPAPTTYYPGAQHAYPLAPAAAAGWRY